MVYVGVLAALIKIDISLIEETINQHFSHVEKAVKPNMDVVKIAYGMVTNEMTEACPLNWRSVISMWDTLSPLVSGRRAGAFLGGLRSRMVSHHPNTEVG